VQVLQKSYVLISCGVDRWHQHYCKSWTARLVQTKAGSEFLFDLALSLPGRPPVRLHMPCLGLCSFSWQGTAQRRNDSPLKMASPDIMNGAKLWRLEPLAWVLWVWVRSPARIFRLLLLDTHRHVVACKALLSSLVQNVTAACICGGVIPPRWDGSLLASEGRQTNATKTQTLSSS
jgi:hypothetical protein